MKLLDNNEITSTIKDKDFFIGLMKLDKNVKNKQ